MGAEISWFPPAPVGPLRVGAIRYGAAFRSSGARHAYDGCGVTQDMGDGVAVIGPLGSEVKRAGWRGRLAWWLLSLLLGRPAEFSRRDWLDILKAHRHERFARVEFERHGAWFEVDLTRRRLRMRRIGRRC